MHFPVRSSGMIDDNNIDVRCKCRVNISISGVIFVRYQEILHLDRIGHLTRKMDSSYILHPTRLLLHTPAQGEEMMKKRT